MKGSHFLKSENNGRLRVWDSTPSQIEESAKAQLLHVAELPFVHKWVAGMPDLHLGKGCAVGSVIPTYKAIIPAAVGVDIGCGMMAIQTQLTAKDLPDSLHTLRTNIEKRVPHGKTKGTDKGAWNTVRSEVAAVWKSTGLAETFYTLINKHPILEKTNNINHLGTLGTGNHFIEICLDELDNVWCMLHSGSRGVGNRIGTYFIELAKRDMETYHIHLPDKDLSYLSEGTQNFDDYVEAMTWAQKFAQINREIMMEEVKGAVKETLGIPVCVTNVAINCHHNYVSKENHFNKNVWVTRKGAVRARKGELGIIPGSMGAKSFIVRGLGNKDSFCSCSHGAGRKMSRMQAKAEVSLDSHIAALTNIECKKDESTLDETPQAYKNIDQVIAAQSDLIEVVHTLRQVVCVKG